MYIRPISWEDPLEEMATRSSILVWETAWREEPTVHLEHLKVLSSHSVGAYLEELGVREFKYIVGLELVVLREERGWGWGTRDLRQHVMACVTLVSRMVNYV